ncbi:MAG: hypothetical protein D6726_12800, partial [Nitrospirae bacterium]
MPFFFFLFTFTFILIMPISAFSEPKTITGKDGIEMVLVPEGSFYMGSKDEVFPPDEKPLHEVFLDAFYIDRYEITNKAFASFLNDVLKDNGGEA